MVEKWKDRVADLERERDRLNNVIKDLESRITESPAADPKKDQEIKDLKEQSQAKRQEINDLKKELMSK
jgi:predicted  nucleic acid-binding Zn-ribbon protein